MSGVPVAGTAPGRTTITARALERLATGLVADAAGVPAGDIEISLHDEAGRLAAGVTLPAVIGTSDRRTLPERGAALRETVTRGMHDLAARQVGSVSVRYAGIHRQCERRVT